MPDLSDFAGGRVGLATLLFRGFPGRACGDEESEGQEQKSRRVFGHVYSMRGERKSN